MYKILPKEELKSSFHGTFQSFIRPYLHISSSPFSAFQLSSFSAKEESAKIDAISPSRQGAILYGTSKKD